MLKCEFALLVAAALYAFTANAIDTGCGIDFDSATGRMKPGNSLETAILSQVMRFAEFAFKRKGKKDVLRGRHIDFSLRSLFEGEVMFPEVKKPSDAAGFFTIGVSPDAKDKGK